MITKFEFSKPEIAESAYVAPTAVVIGRACISERASVWFQSVVRADINEIRIGADSNVQDSCTLHVTQEYPVIIGERVTIGHGAIVHGCTIESDCLIAMGAIILDGVVIGRNSLVAAGAVVAPRTIVPPESMVMGVPAKVIRKLSEKEQENMQENWRHYVEYAERYKKAKII